MRNEIPEEQEFSYAERFEKGDKDFANEDEKRLFQSYSELRDLLHTMPVPKADDEQLMRKLRSELRSGQGKWFQWQDIQWESVVFHPFAIRGLCLLLCVAIIGGGFFLLPENPNLQSIRCQSEENSFL